MSERGHIVVVGVGNRYRGDDAVGRVVARRLSVLVPAGVDVREGDGVATELMNAWTGAAAAFVVDAVVSGAEPGHIHRFDVHVDALPARMFGHTTHGLGVAEAVALARMLGELPPHLVVYGVEAEQVEAGADASPAVTAAVDDVVARILDDIHAVAGRAADV